ncbi:hypothetical protein ADUPG1_013455 [Aduncisulcus paluster]|uniref:Uncharacterized protein n=1 Tax=Aduncisulcus paluster TaxID=2918883 RepID=A0ABQ5K2Z9_9EUKA|nr:hypothetical protein ADUPG1_013455 [Aduncisulcus paluster]
METFTKYLSEFHHAYQTYKTTISPLSSYTSTQDVSKRITTAKRCLGDMRKAVNCMRIEAPRVGAKQQASAKGKAAECETISSTLSKDFERIERTLAADRDQQLSSTSKTRSSLVTTMHKMDDIDMRMDGIRRMASDISGMGNGICDSLDTQIVTLTDGREKVRQMNDNLDDAKILTNTMRKREACQKCIWWFLFILFLLIDLALIIWMYFI